MNKNGKVILVTGATGKQGGAVARQMLSKGWQVRALTRDPDAEAAQVLGKAGAEIIKGNLNDVSSLDRAVAGVYGVFSVQTFREGVERETAQGKNLADAATRADVAHFVYSSVGGADRSTGIPHFESKWKVERHIKSLGLTATVFRPVYFMENFAMPQTCEGILAGTLAMGLDPNRPLQMVAVADIAEFVSLAFDAPAEYAGKAVELAGDELTGPEVAKLFGQAIGKPVTYVQTPLEQLRRISEDYAIMTEWFNKEGYNADISALRKIHPSLKTLAAWISGVEWNRLATAAVAARS